MGKLLGVLVIGVVCSNLVTREVVSDEQKIPWMERGKGTDWTHANTNDCFKGEPVKIQSAGTVMDVSGEEWQMWSTDKSSLWKIERGTLMGPVETKQGKKNVRQKEYKVKRRCRGLWLAALADGCSQEWKKTEKPDEKSKPWCKLLEKGSGTNIALRCSSNDHNTQFTEWSERVQKAEDTKSDENVTFTLASGTKQSILCALPNGNETVDAKENMPDTKQTIGGQNCTLNETVPQDGISGEYCHYEMKWLGQKVASYTCHVRNAKNCEEVIKREFERGSGLFGAQAPEIDKEGELTEKLTSTGINCSLRTDSKAMRESVPARFEFEDQQDKQKREIWCTFPTGDNGKITCEFLTLCQAEIATGFEGKWEVGKIKEGIKYSGEAGGSGLPGNCTIKPGSQPTDKPIKKFQFGNDGKEFWCAPDKEGDPKNITCKFFPPCEVAVREALKSGVSEVIHVDFTGHKTRQNDLVGTNCRRKDGTTAVGITGEFLFSFEKNKPYDGKLSCRKGTENINCTFSPSCAYTVKGAFGKKDQVNAVTAGTLNLGNKECQKAEGKRSNQAKTFRITKKDEENQISCVSTDEKITCEQLPQCEIEVKKAFKGVGESPEIIFGGKVDNQEEDFLYNKKCSKNEVEQKENKIEFFVNETKDTRKNQDILCELEKGTEKPEIKCTLLPPRCQIEGINGAEKKPPRCNQTGKNITFTGDIFERNLECELKNETTFYDKHDTHCSINVTIEGGTMQYYVCKKEEKEAKGKNWCQAIPPPVAKTCFENGLELEKDSPCKNHTASIDVPVSAFEKLKEKCTESNDGRTVEQNKCRMEIKVGVKSNEGKRTYLCGKKNLKEEIEKLCEEIIIPGHTTTIGTERKEKTVKILFQSEETTGESTKGTTVGRRKFSAFALGEPGLWDIEEGSSTSFHYSSLPFLLLALF